MITAETGLHHNTQPEAELELNKNSPNPAAEPMVPPIMYFITVSCPVKCITVMINSPVTLSTSKALWAMLIPLKKFVNW